MTLSGKRLVHLGVAALILGAILTSVLPVNNALAAQITNRSLTLEPGAGGDGGSKPGGTVNHFFQFTVPNAGGGNIGSIQFQYCTTASGTCTVPGTTSGGGNLVNTTTTTLDQTGSAATGFTLVNTTNGTPYLTRTAAAVTANSVLKYTLIGVKNPNVPTTPNLTFFVRISTFASTDTSGSPIDTGTVAASTASQIQLTGIMPESLIFCTGGTIGVNGGGIPDCTTATSGAVSFNQLFSPSDTATATSQMAASTNALSGYSITVAGATLTSGTNTIPAIGPTAAAGSRGKGQFGMNLVANTTATSTPAIGSNVAPAPNGTNLRGQPKAAFGTVDSFAFDTAAANTIAASDNGGAGPTDSQIFTSSYIVNVAGSQPAGTYTTTLTYICTPTF